MLTVKHIMLDAKNDYEQVFEANTIEFHKTAENPKGVVKIWCPRSSTRDGSIVVEAEIKDGTIYVMNDNGKTVANYNLQ